MATETIIRTRPVFTAEQKEAWKKAKLLLKTYIGKDVLEYRALHIAMSELRGKYRIHKGPIEVVSKNANKAYEHKIRDQYYKLRERVDAWKVYFADPGSKKLYVICDETLSDSQKAVQSAHAVAQFQKDHPLAPWTNGTLILLTPDKNEFMSFEKLLMWTNKYQWTHYTEWREPDMDNKITALAVMDNFYDINRLKGLKLL